MIQLFLSESTWNGGEDEESAKLILSLLNELESVISSVISNSGRSEARLWLCKSISGISSITPTHQCEIFENLLKSKELKKGFAAQLVQMFFDKRPHSAGSVIADKCYVLKNFFKGNQHRMSAWFSNTAAGSDLEQKKSVKALFQFAFVNRDICWEELKWKGKHGQSPAVVATKPHYFLDLDIQQTVKNFLEYVPEFWSSDEFADSLKGGEILSIDRKYFVDFFVNLMYKEDSKDMWNVIREFLMDESFSSLCRHLLIGFEEQDLCSFLKYIRKYINFKMETKDFSMSSYWLETVLSMSTDFDSIDQLLLLNSVINQGRHLLRLLHEEENQEEKAKIRDIVLQICAASGDRNSLALILKKSYSTNIIEVIKWLGLQSWVLYYRLSTECCCTESWESLFAKNGVRFRKSEKHSLLSYNENSEEDGSDFNHRATSRDRRKKKERRRKKRKKIDHEDSYGSEILDLNRSNDTFGLYSKDGSWYLSTDEYSTMWSSVDLPEHLSQHCFSTWMKWVSSRVE